MSLAVTFHRAALTEFAEAAAYYESSRQALGVGFIAEIERCVKLASERPRAYAVVHDDTPAASQHVASPTVFISE